MRKTRPNPNPIALPLRPALLAALLTLCCALPASAQTWIGNTSGSWNVASNWSSNPNLPVSSIDTALIFNAAGPGGVLLTQNLAPNPFLLNSLSFNAASSGYTIGGNGIDFRFSTLVVAPHIDFNTTNSVTLNTPLTLTNNLAIFGVGSGALALNGAISGAGGITVNTFATVSLGNASNTFAGPLTVSNGTLVLGNGTAIPTGRNINVFSPGVFSTNGLSNTAPTAIGTVTLNNSTFKIPSGSGNYFLNALQINSPGLLGNTLDFTGSTSATLHFVNPGAAITVNGPVNWTGGGTSRIVNDTAAPLNVTINGNNTLTSSARLANGAAGQGFRIAGSGSAFIVTNTGNSASVIVDENAYLQVADLAFLGTGSLTLANTTALSIPGTLVYTGPSATSSKPLTLGVGGGQIWAGTTATNMTLTGIISETAPGQRLVIAGDFGTSLTTGVTLTASNTYTGPTVIGYGSFLSIPTFANGGVASPLGASSSAPANLLITGHPAGGAATLQYTGPTTTTNRGMTFSDPSTDSNLEISNPATNLTVSGQIVGAGRLIKTGPGALTLTNNTNTVSSIIIAEGRLAVGAAGAVIPANAPVIVSSGAELNLTGFANAAATPTGLITLNGGAIRVSSGSADYFIKGLTIGSLGGTLDYSGSTSADLHFVNPSTLTVNGNSTFTIGTGTTLRNDTGTTMDIVIAPSMTLTNSMTLAGSPIRVTGGGTLYQTAIGTPIGITVDQARMRVDSMNALPNTAFFLDNGTLEYSGPSAASSKPLILNSTADTIEVSNPASTLTLSSAITGSATLVKSGPGTLALTNASNFYTGGITVANGRLDVANDSHLGLANPTVNALGTIRYTNSVTTSRNFNLVGGSLEIPTGQTLTLSGATVGGGFLRGGTFALTNGTTLGGATTTSGATIQQTGPATLTNFTNNGQFFNNLGQTLTWNSGTNTSAGRVIVNGVANVNEFVSNGQLTVPAGAAINNSASSLVLGGGSTTTVGSVAAPGGAINLGGQSLELRGGLVVNNGNINNGTVNVNFGGLAKGSGVYPTVNVNDGGRFSPGNSPGSVTSGPTTWGAGAGYDFEINDAAGTQGVNWDLWNINGDLSITAGTTTNSRFTVSIFSLNAANAPGDAANFNSTQNYSWLIASTTAGITGFATNKFTLDSSTFTNPIGTGSFALSQIGNNLFLNFNAGALPPPQWNVDASGSWATAANWQPTVVPNDPTASANFLGKITAPRTVTLDGDKTVGAIVFDNPNSYTIAPGSGGTLTIAGGVDPLGNDITVANGSHTISVPLSISTSTNAALSGAASLTLSGGLSIAAGETLSQSKSGTLTISGPQTHQEKTTFLATGGLTNLNSNAGAPATAALAATHNLALNINQDGHVALGADQTLRDLQITTTDSGPQQLDLKSPTTPNLFRSIRVYSDDLALAKTTLYAALKNAHAPGAPDPTDGIYDSSQGLHPNSAIGLALLNDLHGDLSVFIRLTRIGDLNLDGQVTISDFIDLASHFNTSGATWQEGDLNYDGSVTISDFIDLASNFNSTYSGEVFPISPQDQQTLSTFAAAHGASVPEPCSLLSLLLPIFTLARRRLRK